MKYTFQMIGTDVELFSRQPDGVIIPAPVYHEVGKGEGDIHADNACMEIAMPPCSTEDQFVETVLEGKRRVEEVIGSYNLVPQWTPSAWVPEQFLTDSRVLLSGCDPDFNAYTMKQNPRVEFEDGLRSAGGHVHISYDGPNVPAIHKLILKEFEIRQGFYGVLIDRDKARTKLYGRAGSYRPKGYGLEIRSPSNWWLEKEEYIRMTFRSAKAAVESAGELGATLADALVQRVINSRDITVARAILDANNLEMPDD
jgi:hypothetical protein